MCTFYDYYENELQIFFQTKFDSKTNDIWNQYKISRTLYIYIILMQQDAAPVVLSWPLHPSWKKEG